MYIPKINLMDDRDEMVEFTRRFSFGAIITAKDNIPVATHLPFVIELRDDKVVILWEKLPREYVSKLSNEIVAFEVEVTELQGKKKLSQNKSAREKERIIDSLSSSQDTAKNLIAEYMRND